MMFSNWYFDYLPKVVLFVPGSGYTILKYFLLLFLFSILYLLCTKIVSRLFPQKKYKINGFISFLYIIGVISSLFNVVDPAEYFSFAPLNLAIAILYLHFGLFFFFIYKWNEIKEKNKSSFSLFSFIRANLWLSSQLESHFIIPLILFQMPAFNSDTMTFYWGIPICMLLVYFLYFEVYLNKLHLLLGLEVPLNSLPDNLIKRYNLIVDKFAKRDNTKITIFKEGFCNAVAMYPQKKVIIGLNVLRDLTIEESMAIAAHEFGHLNDWRTLAAIRRNFYIGDFFVFIFFILVTIKASFYPLLSLIFFLGAFLIYIFVIKKIVLRAEYNADSYVKNFDESIYRHLKTGLEKLRKMNGIDKDYCKLNNANHLDIDERQQMVAQGKFNLKRKSGRMLLIFFLAFIVSLAVQDSYHKYFPSEFDRWENMHDKFHQLDIDKDYDLKIKTITDALTFSIEHFGEQHNNTFITLNDICEFYIDSKEWEKAEKYGLYAYTIGLDLYKERNLKFARCLKNLGEVYYYKGNYTGADKWFDLALQTETLLEADEVDKADTLDWLGLTAEKQEKSNQAIEYYSRAVEIYEKEGDDGYYNSIYTSIDLAGLLLAAEMNDDANRNFEKALHLAKTIYDKESEDFADVLSRIGNKYYENEDYQKAEQHFLQAVDILKKTLGEENARVAAMYNNLGGLYKQKGELTKAINAYQQGVTLQEKIFGKMDSSTLYGVWGLALANEEAGNLIQAKKLYQRVIDIKQLSADIDIKSLTESYHKLISVLDKLGDKDTSSKLRKKINDLNKNVS